MRLIQPIREWLSSESESVSMYTCIDCSNPFTRTEAEVSPEMTCPNCGSSNVELAASSG